MATFTQTTLTNAITVNQTTFAVGSATGIVGVQAGFVQKAYIIDPGSQRGELVSITALSGLQISVTRLDEFRAAHAAGSIILIANVDPTLGPQFEVRNPDGTPPSTFTPMTLPFLNVATGEQWLQSIAGTWISGWNSTTPTGTTAAVASVAGPILPTGRLFHVTGALAVTGITTPIGFAGGAFTVIPDGAFTWTTGDGSIAVAGTAVVNRALVFTWDPNASKWNPSYV